MICLISRAKGECELRTKGLSPLWYRVVELAELQGCPDKNLTFQTSKQAYGLFETRGRWIDPFQEQGDCHSCRKIGFLLGKVFY